MPKVKKKTARRTKRKTKQAKKGPGFLEAVAGFWGRFSRAALAGITVVFLIAAALLWSGGYLGLAGEKLGRMADASAVSAGFEVKRITVKGLDKASEADLLSAIGPVIGTSLLHFDPFGARARVEEMGWVRVAAVSRLLPDTVHVSVREREPAAVWQLSGALYLIDPAGAVIREINAYEYAHLPLIVGAGAPGAASGILQSLRDEPALWSRASALIRVSDRRWNMRTENGIDIKFPEQNYQEAVRYLAKLQESLQLLDEDLEYIDLRNPENFVYRRKASVEEKIPKSESIQ